MTGVLDFPVPTQSNFTPTRDGGAAKYCATFPARRATMSTRPTENYVDPKRLAQLVGDYQRSGAACDELGTALLKIARGIWDRYHYTASREDFAQEVATHLLGHPLNNASIQKNVFAYLTTCAIRFAWKLRDKACKDVLRFQTYAAELVESGRAIPDVNEVEDVSDQS